MVAAILAFLKVLPGIESAITAIVNLFKTTPAEANAKIDQSTQSEESQIDKTGRPQ